MNLLEVFNKYKAEIENKLGHLLLKFHKNDIPIFLIIYDDILNTLQSDEIINTLPVEWIELKNKKIIDIVIKPHPLTIFNNHAIQLDDFFDDSLIINYNNFEKPTYDIQYGDDVNPDNVRKNLPDDWKLLEKYNIVDINIRKYEVPDFLESQQFNDLQDKFMDKLNNLKK